MSFWDVFGEHNITEEALYAAKQSDYMSQFGQQTATQVSAAQSSVAALFGLQNNWVNRQFNNPYPPPEYNLPGPKPSELLKYPALKEAWDEFKVIQKLTLGR